MKKIFLILSIGFFFSVNAQETVLPTKPHKGVSYIKNATIHLGNGKVVENGTIKIVDGKIAEVGTNVSVPAGTTDVVDATGKHVYPGLILATSTLGLGEINSVRATQDSREIGDMNPNVRALVAYNTDSKVINTLRSNGILLANIIPQGSFVTGSSSVVQLDAWNWEDAAYKTDAGIHVTMPSLMARPGGRRFGGGGGSGPQQPASDPVKEGLEQMEGLKSFLREAKAYLNEASHEETNLKYEAVKGLFNKSQKLYMHGNTVKQILVALDFVKEFGLEMVLVGGSESFQVAELLKQHNVSVILSQPHSLPTGEDDDVDQPYKTAAVLQKAGVLFAISDEDGQTRGRNLSFNAGTAAAYGLTKEEALAAITLNAAKIMGVADKAGSIEVGKDANIVVSEGDILDMRTSNVTDAFIQGRKIDLTDKHKLLNDRFQQKYELKKKGF
ncbi:MAG: amidohydrolase family protein [Chitinophagaceae bacterium]|nr:amidohydrolase family protein [Chitinophagaceae bacterium]MBK8606902.1 amidohydrolase family protein [Chitinophagaceae bacterium]MBP6477164.1 amidohydrolase family protein [Chitinophagaceae bacterium]MBP7109036.1 amidohydrolase family protein [Chitinophagaceae bacterium]MBP7316324.1 amidohydrolase family protein [Chitinophagaceae bacterium]